MSRLKRWDQQVHMFPPQRLFEELTSLALNQGTGDRRSADLWLLELNLVEKPGLSLNRPKDKCDSA